MWCLNELERKEKGRENLRYQRMQSNPESLKMQSGFTSVAMSEDEVDFAYLLDQKHRDKSTRNVRMISKAPEDSDMMLYNRL